MATLIPRAMRSLLTAPRLSSTPTLGRSPARLRVPTAQTFHRSLHTSRTHVARRALARSTRLPPRRGYATPPPAPVPPAPASLSQRMRALSREYGYSAVGIYFALSALDFPFCFLAVRAVGTERIGEWEHTIVDAVKGGIGKVVPSLGERWEKQRLERVELEMNAAPVEAVMGGPEVVDGNIAGESNGNGNGSASLGTQLALAYAIHKSFIFIRVPLTAAITPKVVKTLRSWGWNIGKKKVKAKV